LTNKILTTATGAPVPDNQNSITAGPRGPVLMQDHHLLDKVSLTIAMAIAVD